MIEAEIWWSSSRILYMWKYMCQDASSFELDLIWLKSLVQTARAILLNTQQRYNSSDA